ncbi:MAG TPA: NADPH-dependent F420 reductase [Anaeromyxobacter sp.]|nr:NADPH-dependent F420 reductase [Anaeromyxobacter sp.]
MRIGVLGSGQIGGTAAKLFARAGHEVALSHSGPPDTLREQVAELGAHARATTIRDAAVFGDVVLLAIPWRSRADLPAEQLRGKIVIDAMNHDRPDMGLYDLAGSTSSEEVARAVPGARLVKAMNTLPADDLLNRGRPGAPMHDRVVMPIAGDDSEAKAVVAHLMAEIGFAPLDTGLLRTGGVLQQPGGGPLAGKALTLLQAEAALQGRGAEGEAAAP